MNIPNTINGATLVDPLGRTITFRKPTVVDKLKSGEVLNFKNEENMIVAHLILHISSITDDGNIFLVPHPINSVNEFYSIAAKLKEEGINAGIKFMNKLISESVDAANEEEVVKK